MLILDEPTSGVDPVARDALLGAADRPLAASRGHDLRLDALHERGRALRPHLADACRARCWRPDTPADLVAARGAASLEEAFIAYLEEAAERAGRAAAGRRPAPGRRRAGSQASAGRRRASASAAAGLSRAAKALELRRDPIRLGFALLGTAAPDDRLRLRHHLDVEHLTFAVLDRDQTPRAGPTSHSFAARAISSSSRRSPTMPSSTGGCATASCAWRSRSRPASAATSTRGRPVEVARLDRRRHAVPRRDGARLRGGRARAISGPARSRRPPERQPRAPAHDRDALPLQPGLPERLRHGAGDHPMLLMLIPAC